MSADDQHAPAWGEPGSWIRLPDERAAQVWSEMGGSPAANKSTWVNPRGHRRCAFRWVVTADQTVHLIDLDELDTQPVAQDDLFGGAG